MAMVDERLEELSPSLVDWGITSDTQTALDEPSTISSTPPPPDPLSVTPPPSTPTRPSRRPLARREMSLSMSPSVVSRTRSLSDPFAPPAHGVTDLWASPLEGDIQIPANLDGSFGYGGPDSSLDGVLPDRFGSIDEDHEQPLSPSTSSSDPVADDKTDSVLGALNSNPELLSFSIVQEDLDDDGAEEFANENADESFVESTNFREYFDSRGIKFNYIDIYRPVRTDDEVVTVPLLSTAIILQSEPAMMEYKDMGSGQVTWVPALMATLAIPGSFKATMNRIRMSMMLVTCVAGLISLDPPTLDFGNHQSYWSRIVDISISGDPKNNPLFHHEDSGFEDDEKRFEIIADGEDSSTPSQPSSAISSRHGQKISTARLLGWRSPTLSSSPYNDGNCRCPQPDATSGSLGDGSDGAKGGPGCVHQSNETPLVLPPDVRQLSSTSSIGYHDTLPVLDPGERPTASGLADNCPSDVSIARQLSDFTDLDGPLNPDPFGCAVLALPESTDVRHSIATEDDPISPGLGLYVKDEFSLLPDQSFNNERGHDSSSFAEESFFAPDASYGEDGLNDEREGTPSMISDSSSSVPRSSASPEFLRLASSLDLGGMLEGDLSLSDAMLFTPPIRFNSEVDSCDSDVIKQCFGSNPAFSSPFTPPRAMAPSPTRKRRPFAPRNENIEWGRFWGDDEVHEG
ncbi:hypothetical protein BD410DRAFT_794536 [Rickenella mellea]|uniref:Uncharacterized protein n=1 Tax=Rickenella mellea TaxID=50990 RepID=A0A4Y7PP78_9AGAM|nr:hypothetical protein BD410DRAFT_794536 [Rickenella mellea]